MKIKNLLSLLFAALMVMSFTEVSYAKSKQIKQNHKYSEKKNSKKHLAKKSDKKSQKKQVVAKNKKSDKKHSSYKPYKPKPVSKKSKADNGRKVASNQKPHKKVGKKFNKKQRN